MIPGDPEGSTGAGKDYIHLPDGPLVQVDWSIVPNPAICIHGHLCPPPRIEIEHLYYFHNDYLGTPIKMTDESGTPKWDLEYRPFGDGTPTGDATNNLRFPGQYFDAESGLHQNWFRDYSSIIGRFHESDPIGLAAGVDPYAYGADNPTDRIDPRGLEDQCRDPKPDCKQAKAQCIEQCLHFVGRSKDYGPNWDFLNCITDCMKAVGCEENYNPWPRRPPLFLPLPPLLPRPMPRPLPLPALPPISPGLRPVLPVLPILSPCVLAPELFPTLCQAPQEPA
jgi:RHS repeat-associated protein